MSEILRSRDCVVFFKKDSTTVTVSDAMVRSGWAGGQGVMWSGSVGDDRVVTYSNGLYGGFLMFGSAEAGDRFTAISDQQTAYRHAVMFFGGCLIATSTYERYTYASRLGGGAVPIAYKANDILYLSSRGYWTNEDEMTLSGNALAPAFFAGFVAQIPKANNNYWLGIQTSM